MPRKQDEFQNTVSVRRVDNGFIVTASRDLGMQSDTYVANDYNHMTAIIKELLGPVEFYPEYVATTSQEIF